MKANKYSKFDIQRVKEVDIRQILPGCNSRKAKQEIDCPNCGKKKFSVVHQRGAMNFAKCWACDFKLSGPLEAFAYFNHLDVQKDFLRCVEGVADSVGLTLIPEKEIRAGQVQEVKKAVAKSFCARQLEQSGLTVDDVMATVVENGQEFQASPFVPGSFVPNFTFDSKGTDMMIRYYDLHGRPVQYFKKGQKTSSPYWRARFANPDAHVSSGKPMKYQTAADSPATVYIPEKVRRLFQRREQFDVLFLQEGEKKAEKACKHGLISLGLQGIQNFGSKGQGLLQPIQDVVQACGVKHVVFVMDSDWCDLSRNLVFGDAVDLRPRSFASAVIKYKQYMQTFHNLQLSVDIWWGHVNHNENGDKGVDDLLVGSLNGREDELLADVDKTMHSHNGRGVWLDVHKITAMSDMQIRDFWHLNDNQKFFEVHKERLTAVGNFRLGGVTYKVENDALTPVSRYASDTDIFSVEKDSNGSFKKVKLNYEETYKFLEASGFYRLLDTDSETYSFQFVHRDAGIVRPTVPSEMRSFILAYIRSNVKTPIVREFFFSRIDTLLPAGKFENLIEVRETVDEFFPGVQYTSYANGRVEITSTDITPGLPFLNTWRSRILDRDFRRVPIIKSITKTDEGFTWELSDDAANCEFLQYLINTSNNFYPHNAVREVTEEEAFEWMQQLVNKITALGYLLSDWKYSADRQAVALQDHKMSEVGQSWGGAGKSIFGAAIGKVAKQFFIDGKNFSFAGQFVLSGVTRATRNIFIDDVKPNFDFPLLFKWVTGPMPINPKGTERYVIQPDRSPKILVSTNHAIKNADEGSVRRRIAYVEFSSWYNADHSLFADFKHMFFDDWDEYQWTLFDNLMAECVMYYFRSFNEEWHEPGRGVVPPPMRSIELRTQRQALGETFLAWADEYFDPAGVNLNERRSRRDIWGSFLEYAGTPNGHGITRSNLRRKLELYCKFKGYDFNVNKPNKDGDLYAQWKPLHPEASFIGGDDKGGGVEYITIYSPELEKEKKPF